MPQVQSNAGLYSEFEVSLEYTVLDPLKYTEAANRDPGPWGFFQLPWNSDQVLSFLHGCGERYTDQGL